MEVESTGTIPLVSSAFVRIPFCVPNPERFLDILVFGVSIIQ